VVRENQTAELQPVTLQMTEGNDVAIASGLKPDEMVMLEGMDKVQDGTRVEVQTPGQATDSGAGERSGGAGGGGRAGRGRGGRRGQGNGQ
jgi:multidrug efflux system membrane fusion protein